MFFRTKSQFLAVLSIIFLVSCKAYKQDLLFQLPDQESSVLSEALYETQSNYILQPNDWIEAQLFYRDGEQLINLNFRDENLGGNNQQMQNQVQSRYLVQSDGSVKLPMVGTFTLAGMTIDQAERMLEKEFDQIFKGSFLKLVYQNKRVTVLGAVNAVVHLENENTSLLEVLALSGGVQFGAKAQNIRILRGELNNPQVFQVDLTTVEGMQASMVHILPGDVIYVEPWRRPWLEVLRDVSPVLGVTTGVSTLVFLLVNSLNNSDANSTPQ